MGLPALRQEPLHEQVAERPRLHVVQPETRTRTAARSASAKQQSVKRAYRSFVLLVVLVAAFSGGRVWLTASTAQATIEVAELQSQIQAAQNVNDNLEVKASSLSSPTRIAKIAESQLGMTSSVAVSYLDISSVPSGDIKGSGSDVADAGSSVSGVLAQVMSVAAGEAQQLLVGDVGLAAE